ncbi:MAG: response regulator transcription factor, partial [Pseudomonadota bacterium]
LIEDNQRLADLVREGVLRSGHTIDVVHTKSAAEHAATQFDYELLILDLGLPDGDGLELLRVLRRKGIRHPCLILTARDALRDRVTGLDSGADDYLTKPFAMEELVARINALLRRPSELVEETLQLGNLRVDTRARTLEVASQAVKLSIKEFTALECLIRATSGRCSRQRLEDSVYGMDAAVTPNALEVLMYRLRKQLKSAGSTVQISTVRDFGYALEERNG